MCRRWFDVPPYRDKCLARGKITMSGKRSSCGVNTKNDEIGHAAGDGGARGDQNEANTNFANAELSANFVHYIQVNELNKCFYYLLLHLVRFGRSRFFHRCFSFACFTCSRAARFVTTNAMTMGDLLKI